MVILDISAVNVALPDLARDLQIGAGRPPATRCSSAACSCSAGAPPTCSVAGASASPAERLHGSVARVRPPPSARQRCLPPAQARNSARRCCRRRRSRSSRRASGARSGREPPGAQSAAPAPPSGVLLGGVLTQVADWRAIFFINLPVATGVALIGRNVMPADPRAPLGGTVQLLLGRTARRLNPARGPTGLDELRAPTNARSEPAALLHPREGSSVAAAARIHASVRPCDGALGGLARFHAARPVLVVAVACHAARWVPQRGRA